MVADIRKLTHAVAFVPFTIHVAGGPLRIAAARVIVFRDDDTHEIVSPLLISRITVGQDAAKG